MLPDVRDRLTRDQQPYHQHPPPPKHRELSKATLTKHANLYKLQADCIQYIGEKASTKGRHLYANDRKFFEVCEEPGISLKRWNYSRRKLSHMGREKDIYVAWVVYLV